MRPQCNAVSASLHFGDPARELRLCVYHLCTKLHIDAGDDVRLCVRARIAPVSGAGGGISLIVGSGSTSAYTCSTLETIR